MFFYFNEEPIKVKAFFWHEVDRETALKVIRHKFFNMNTFGNDEKERLNYLNLNCVWGTQFSMEEIKG